MARVEDGLAGLAGHAASQVQRVQIEMVGLVAAQQDQAQDSFSTEWGKEQRGDSNPSRRQDLKG